MIDGQLAGRWRRTLKASTVVIEVQPFRPLTTAERGAIDAAAARHGRFMNMAVTLSLTDVAAIPDTRALATAIAEPRVNAM